MIDDLRKMPDGQTLEGDICIIGAGPAGIALAQALSGFGLRILLLESGGLAVEPSSQTLNEAESIGLPHNGAVNGRARSLGGTGRIWAGQCVRLDPIDFERRSWVPGSGWPIGVDVLKPFYVDAERFFGVENLPTNSNAYSLFDLTSLGWTSSTIATMFTVYTPEVDVGRHHRKSLKKARDIRTILHANVVHIDTEGTRTKGLQLRTLAGQTAYAHAKAYVLCAGGIENARLLLASNEQRSEGLGNARDLVGRYFQEHPNGVTATIEGGDAVNLQRRFRILHGRHRYFPKFSLTRDAQRRDGTLNANAHLTFEEAADPGMAAFRAFVTAARARKLPAEPLRQSLALMRRVGAIGRAGYARARGGAIIGKPSAIRLQCFLEQAPNPQSRITLGSVRDSLGMRQAVIDWQMTEQERHTARVLTDQVALEFGRLNLGRVRQDDWLIAPGSEWQLHFSDCYHHAGTTRMAADHSQGVVDPTLRLFDVTNLYVCGGSVFPTSGYANPTLTIVALAFRLAEHLRSEITKAAM